MVCPSYGAEQTLSLEEEQRVEFSMSTYILGGGEALNDVTFFWTSFALDHQFGR